MKKANKDLGGMARANSALQSWISHHALLLCALGAILGLLIAGYGLFTARGTRVAGVPPEDVAIVNRVPILRSDYSAQLAALYGVSPSKATPAQRQTVFNAMIREELYVQRGLELGLASDDIDVRSALVASTEAMTVADVLSSQPTEEELSAYYRQHQAQYASEGTMLLADFVLQPSASSAEAVNAAAKLRTAPRSPPAELAKTDKFADGAEYYFAARIHLGPGLFNVAQSMIDGQVSEPIASGGRFHILAMILNSKPVPRPLSEVRDAVINDFQKAKSARVEAANERYLRQRADIQRAAGFD